MDNLTLPQTLSTPAVELDAAGGVLRLDGESYPENSFEFFQPIKEWLAAYLAQGGPVTLELRLRYLNTSSVKCMLDILEMLERAHRNGGAVRVRWYHAPENLRAVEMAEDFSEDLTLPFEVVAEG